jgi:hypothetical protein
MLFMKQVSELRSSTQTGKSNVIPLSEKDSFCAAVYSRSALVQLLLRKGLTVPVERALCPSPRRHTRKLGAMVQLQWHCKTKRLAERFCTCAILSKPWAQSDDKGRQLWSLHELCKSICCSHHEYWSVQNGLLGAKASENMYYLCALNVPLTTHPLLGPTSRKSGSYTSSPPSASMVGSGTALL